MSLERAWAEYDKTFDEGRQAYKLKRSQTSSFAMQYGDGPVNPREPSREDFEAGYNAALKEIENGR